MYLYQTGQVLPRPIQVGKSVKAAATSNTNTAITTTFRSVIGHGNINPAWANRSDRFPSVDERVRFYMARWYAPPCADDQKLQYTYKEASSPDHTPELMLSYFQEEHTESTSTKGTKQVSLLGEVHVHRVFYLAHNTTRKDTNTTSIPNCSNSLRNYCDDTDISIWNTITREMKDDFGVRILGTNGDIQATTPPLLMRFGDAVNVNREHERVPQIRKARKAMPADKLKELASVQCRNHQSSPEVEWGGPNRRNGGQDGIILWRLNNKRHYSMVEDPDFAGRDTAWTQKRNLAVWRGAFTGLLENGRRSDPNKSELQNCLLLQRCRMVYDHSDSVLLDAHFHKMHGRLNETINGTRVLGDKMHVDEMLQYKGLLILEGNDVSSALKWAMYSQSVVLMPRPTQTSWAMEELLEPWVHYIPLEDDLTDMKEKVQWLIDNDEKAKQISERATLWIKDLVLSPVAKEDEKQIQKEILRRYRAHFINN
jgi:hypothetical protein